MNEDLRAHVTGTAFNLTLGKTHIAALVYLDESIRQRAYIRTLGGRNVLSTFIPAIDGLKHRGLVTHQWRERPKDRTKDHLGRYYTITKAGRLVIGLLKEAGIWQEYLDTLPIRREEAS